MDRRRFVNGTLRAGVEGAAWPARAGTLGARPPALPQPSWPLPGDDVQGRKLIIPADNPDRFRLKVMEFNPVAAPDQAKWIGKDYDCSWEKA
jgi:hypothetical protein